MGERPQDCVGLMDAKAGLQSLLRYFLRLGTLGFGGPIALTAAMQRDLVDERGWFTQDDFKQGMALSQMAPGPLAAQMAMYLGWLHSGWLSAAWVGLAFVLPSFLMVIALANLYIAWGDQGFIQGLFRGIGPAVIAIIAIGTHKLCKKNLERSRMLWSIALVNAIATIVTRSEVVSLMLLSGVFLVLKYYASSRTPKILAGIILPSAFLTGIHDPANTNVLVDILIFFTKAGAAVFGSGLAIVPFLHGGVVKEFQWLNEQQFLDAVAVAMITPGPVVITVGFIGYLTAGLAGAVVAAIGTFLPCYFFTVIPAPYFHRIVKNPGINQFITGVTAAAIGAIGGAVVVLGQQSLRDIPSWCVALASLVILLRWKTMTEPKLILLAGIVGLLLQWSLV
jgi:chromate transporter